MSIIFSEVCTSTSDAEKQKVETFPVIPFVPDYTVDGYRTEKNRDDLITVICRYRHIPWDSKKRNMRSWPGF